MVSPAEQVPAREAERTRHDLAELAASRRTMVETMGRHIDWLVTHVGISRTEAAERARTPHPYDPSEQPPEQVTWSEIETTLEADPARGQALWQSVKQEARRELAVGVRASESLERRLNAQPWERAQYLALVEALATALQPRDGLERLLVQQMASAYEQHLRWQTLAAQRVEEETWQGERDRRRALEAMSPRQRDRYQECEGWLPPRQGDAEAIEQAVLIADRYQRAFLRLMKAFRDNRRLFGSLIVAGGQVNIGERQVNIERPT